MDGVDDSDDRTLLDGVDEEEGNPGRFDSKVAYGRE